jgi:predicted dehydrogenase
MIYRAALIGCGNIGSLYADDSLIKSIYTHAQAYIACQHTELVAVCDTQSEKATACAQKWNVAHVYTDVLALLREHPLDIVSLCTPDETHADLVELVLNTPGIRAVIVEKPLALDERHARYLVQLAQQRGIILAVNYSRRYSKGHSIIREEILKNELGTLQTLSGFYTKGLFHNGTHWLDLSRWLVGEIKNVHGFNTTNVSAWLNYENGVTGFLQGLDANAFSLFEMDIIGTQGRIKIIDSGHKVEYFTVSDSLYYSGYKTLNKVFDADNDMKDTLLNLVTDIVNCLNDGTQPICSGNDGLAAITVAAAIMQSIKNHSMIYLHEGAMCQSL